MPQSTAAPTPAERISSAQRSVHQALEQWDATDLNRACQCRELLEQAVGELREAARTAPGVPLDLPVGARRALADLKRDAAGMTRVVDACSAFQREVALRMGKADPNYDASGQAPSNREPQAPEVALDV